MNIRSLMCAMILLSVSLFGAYFKDLETTVYQPDGTKLNVFSSGDEFYNYLHDADGYKIIQGADRYYYYAEMVNGKFRPTSYKAGEVSAKSIQSLDKNINITAEEYKQRVDKFNEKVNKDIKAPSAGTMNNITIYIKFADQDEFEDPRSAFDLKYNGTGEGVVSLKNYFLETSYNKLEINTTHYPVCDNSVSLSYTSPYPRSYYVPYDPVLNPDGYTDQAEREHELLKDAIESIADEVPDNLNIDSDNDGYVDNICFVIRGQYTAWAELLWAHQWVLYSYDVPINGKYVWTYTFQPENQNVVRTLCHEMFHAVGATDLYHYDFDGMSPAGMWDIMERGTGHMTAYMKYYYAGWISQIPQITASGEYTLNPLTSATNNCFMIKPDSYSSDFYVIEYRKKIENSFEKDLPGSGLIVYRINENYQGWGNSSGPPDELFIFRENGSISNEGNIINANLSLESNRTAINDYSEPCAFNSNGGLTGLNIYNIGLSGDSISFYVDMENSQYPPFCSLDSIINGTYIPYGEAVFKPVVSSQGAAIEKTDFFINDSLVFTDTVEPFEYSINFTQAELGTYNLKTTASTADLFSSDEKIFKIYDPEKPTWFYYYTQEPLYGDYNRGDIPLKIAVIYDLGSSELYVNGFSINLAQDPYGQNEVPGEFTCTINRFENDEISDYLIADLGTFISPMDGRYEQVIKSNVKLTGKIAFIADIGIYQSIRYDKIGISGNNYATIGQLWVNAASRNVIGAFDMALILSKNPTSIEDIAVPTATELYQNYPNPFNPTTEISYALKSEGQVTLSVFNTKGELVRSLVNEKKTAGNHSVNFSGEGLNSGIYFYRLNVDGKAVQSRKMMMLK